MRSPNNSLPCDIRFICGQSGSGKSYSLKKELQRETNVYVMDIKNEYGELPGFRIAHSRAEFVKALRSGGKWAYPAPATEFDFFCRGVWARGSCLCVAEELACCSPSSGRAVGAWHLILTQGRGYGIRTVGVAQRPAEVDKTIIAMSTLLRTHRHLRADDRVYVAKELDIPLDEVKVLKGLDYIERNVLADKIVRKKVRK